jgi:tetratricopeptide (TPR) repeat protein
MKTLKILIAFLCITYCSCGQNKIKRKKDPNVVRLNNCIISLIQFTNNTDSCKKAILLLDSATAIDSSDYLVYWNKLPFLAHLKEYNKAIVAINNILRLEPNANDVYLMGGMFYEKIKDTITSKIYFQKSLTICNSALDTMNVNNRDYSMLVGNKAVNLIMLGEQAQADKLLKKLSETETNDEDFKKMTLSLAGKPKQELIDEMTGNK